MKRVTEALLVNRGALILPPGIVRREERIVMEKRMMGQGTGAEHGVSREHGVSTKTDMQRIAPNAVREGDRIEAHFPNGEIERGIAVPEEKPAYHCRYRSKRRMMLCENGARRGHIITGCAGFPDGTKFYRVG